MKVLLGTRNPHKLAELKRVLGEISGIEWVDFHSVPFPEVAETGETLEENAKLKALAIARATGLPTLAEDTGLEVFALGGAPGVRSARFAGEQKDYQANNEKLLRLLEGVVDRRARFRAVAALALPDGRLWSTEGVLEGEIAHVARGEGGFGYDPLFIPIGERRTLAEMTPEEKDAISHRRRALERMRPLLSSLAQGELQKPA
ncbi:non-canonical purine NTP pyrophosphatase, RdgB/HAM1 family [Candidatus Acetothermia bacterium]|nr:MAG: non-canonical purine NTP pyrophosphatase, RdgB/HAM1 family [Candidatus Acetothermia bacterium]